MTKKAEFIIKDNADKELEDFYSKQATKAFNKLAAGTPVKIFIKENEFAEQYVGNYIIKGLPNEPEEPVPEPSPEPEPTPTPEPEPTPEPTPTPEPEPIPEPTPSPAGLIYDSHIHSKLHDNKVRTVEKEGSISAGGLGVECRASGSPKIQVNNDGTFSLICGSGHGRFYLYCLNYDAALEIEFAWWNEAKGQDLSTKLRSRHNEDGDCSNRFGGYGLSVDRTSYDAKREDCHNIHSQAKSGSIPKIGTKEYHTLRFEVKDEGNTVVQVGKLDGKEIMKKVDTSPKPYMTAKASFAQQSYLWIRQNCEGQGEIRIKSLKVFKL